MFAFLILAVGFDVYIFYAIRTIYDDNKMVVGF